MGIKAIPALVPKRHQPFPAGLFLSDGSAKMLPKTGSARCQILL
jgi:hypothetical protein